MFCSNCGTQNGADAAFCVGCGTKLTAQQSVPVQQQYYQPPLQPMYQPYYYQPPAPVPGKGMGVAALVLGIIGLVTGTVCACGCACLGGIIPAIVCIVGLVLGIMAMNKSKAAGFKNTKALVGVILSGVGLASIVLFVLINAIIGGLNGMSQAQGYGDNYFSSYGY